MNMSRYFAFLQIVFVCGTVSISILLPGRAQDQSQTPQAPYVAAVPKDAHWTITLKYPASGNPAPASSNAKSTSPDSHPLQIDTLKSGTSKQITVTYPDGKSARYDFLGKYMMKMTATGPSVSIAATLVDPPCPFYTPDFLFTDWVRAQGTSAFKGVVPYNGVTCFHYQNSSGEEAWINTETMLPVAAKKPLLAEADYQFLSPPDSPLVFPAVETNAISNIENTAKVLQSVR